MARAQSEFCMKKYQLHTKSEDTLKRFPALCKFLQGAERMPAAPGAPWVLCLGADIEKAGACVAVQCGLSEPVSLGTVTRETVLSPLPVLRARGWHSVLGLEACGFGWRFQRQLREAGAGGADLRHRGAHRPAQDQPKPCSWRTLWSVVRLEPSGAR